MDQGQANTIAIGAMLLFGAIPFFLAIFKGETMYAFVSLIVCLVAGALGAAGGTFLSVLASLIVSGLCVRPLATKKPE